MTTTWEVIEWCDCDYSISEMRNGVVFCEGCNRVIECEFCEDKIPSTFIHLDYVACKEHKGAAIGCAYR